MNIKACIKSLWSYVKDMAEDEELDLDSAFDATIEGFEYDADMITNELIDSLSDIDARALLFSIGFMAVNELFGGDFETWNYTLDSLGVDDEMIEFLNY